MRSFLLVFVLLGLVGCSSNQSTFNAPLIDCGNGYYVNPPLACPELDKK